MKKLALLAILMLIVSAAFAADYRVGDGNGTPWSNSDRDTYTCDDGTGTNGLYQDNLTVYGNAFDVGAGGQLTTLEFVHHAWQELHGPYDYKVFVYAEDDCTVLYEIGPLQAADAYDTYETETVDMTSYGIVVAGNVVVGIQALSLSPFGYYHPTVAFEELPLDGCMRQVDIGTSSGCSTPSDSGDFAIRITVEPTTAAAPFNFSAVKALY